MALATPVSGLPWSSKGASSTLKPILVRGSESCSMASWVPLLMSLPITDMAPDRGLWVAILMVLFSFSQPAASSRQSVAIDGANQDKCFFMGGPPGLGFP